MSLIAHKYFPRSMFRDSLDMDHMWPSCRSPSSSFALDMFDPFDDFDRSMSRHFKWLDTPRGFLAADKHWPSSASWSVPRKCRVTVDCSGYSPSSIKTEIRDDKLIVTGQESVKASDDDYSVREFKKTYNLPANVESDKLVSFLAPNGQLVVEIPVRQEQTVESNNNSLVATRSGVEDLFPRIVDAANGAGKQVSMRVCIPKNIDASKVSVTCKDREVIVKAEEKMEKSDEFSQMHYYRRTTMPENADLANLKCELDKNNVLTITAPIFDASIQPSQRNIPIRME